MNCKICEKNNFFPITIYKAMIFLMKDNVSQHKIKIEKLFCLFYIVKSKNVR